MSIEKRIVIFVDSKWGGNFVNLFSSLETTITQPKRILCKQDDIALVWILQGWSYMGNANLDELARLVFN